jgi:hypothetical protein
MNDNARLRAGLIRLAHSNPALRPQLLPLVKEASRDYFKGELIKFEQALDTGDADMIIREVRELEQSAQMESDKYKNLASACLRIERAMREPGAPTAESITAYRGWVQKLLNER